MTTMLAPRTASALESHDSVEIAEGLPIRMVSPLPGLEQWTRFTLNSIEDSPVYWLQSVDDRDLALAVADAFAVCQTYDVSLRDGDAHALDLQRPEEALVLTVLTVGETGAITANLYAPLLVNRRTGAARQVILENTTHSLRHPIG